MVGHRPGAPGRGLLAGLALCAALGAVGAGVFVIGSSRPEASLRPVAAGRPVNAGARDDSDVRAHNSPTVARNPVHPSNLAVAARVDTPEYSCSLHISHDDARTWAEVPIPFPEGEELPPRCFAPDVAYGGDGVLYLAFVTLKGRGNVPNAAWLTSSRDGGRTLSPPARVLGPFPFQVHLLADPVKPGRLHLSWLQAEEVGLVAFPNPANPVRHMRSDDGGATWTAPVTVSSPGRLRAVAPSMAVGPRGRLYVLYLALGEDKLDYHGGHEWRGGDPYPGTWELVLARSDDSGASWQETTVEARLVPTQRILVFLPPSPSLAVDGRSGRVYVGYHDGRRGNPDVWVWSSENGGTTFRTPRRVNDTAAGERTTQHLPKLDVAAGGRLDVVYYDRRRDRRDVMSDVSLQSSFDGGRTFTPAQRLNDRPFDSRIGFGGRRGMPDLGTRLGLAADRGGALALWADTRRGTADTPRQDLALAVLGYSKASPLRAPLRGAGVGLALAGLVALLSIVVLDQAGKRPRNAQ